MRAIPGRTGGSPSLAFLLAAALALAACGTSGTSPAPSPGGSTGSPGASPSTGTASPSPAPSGGSSPAPSGPGWLAFVSVGGSTPAIVVSRLDGSERRTVTTPDWYVGSSLSWAGDGTRIVFETVECDVDPCATELAVVDVRDGTTTRLTDWPTEGRPTEYSPFDQHPDWSSDARRIVFSTSREATGSGDIGRLAVVEVATGAIEVLPLPAGIVAALHPVWSPDGAQIAFDGRTAEGTTGIYVMAADDTGAARLVTADWAGGSFDWSLDGTTLVLTAMGEPAETAPGEFTSPQNLALQPVDGSAPRWLTTGLATDQDPVWALLDTHVVFRSDRSGGGLWVVAVTGGEPLQVPETTDAGALDWLDAPPVAL